jgi:hypothetical protein
MRTFGTAAVLLVVAVLALALAGLGASAPVSCQHADSARTVGLFVQSADEYAGILKKQPSSRCAQLGMAALCGEAKGLRDGHRTREARDLYTAMLNHEPGRTPRGARAYRPCAEDGVAATSPAAGTPGPAGSG